MKEKPKESCADVNSTDLTTKDRKGRGTGSRELLTTRRVGSAKRFFSPLHDARLTSSSARVPSDDGHHPDNAPTPRPGVQASGRKKVVGSHHIDGRRGGILSLAVRRRRTKQTARIRNHHRIEKQRGRKHIHDARRPSARVEVDRWMRADPTDNDDDNRPTIETPPTAVFDVTMMMRWWKRPKKGALGDQCDDDRQRRLSMTTTALSCFFMQRGRSLGSLGRHFAGLYYGARPTWSHFPCPGRSPVLPAHIPGHWRCPK
jgi:hypothetical protein